MHSLTDEIVIDGSKIRIAGSHRIGEPTSEAPTGPSLKLQRQGDRITGVEIVCSCGEVIRLAFEYDSKD